MKNQFTLKGWKINQCNARTYISGTPMYVSTCMNWLFVFVVNLWTKKSKGAPTWAYTSCPPENECINTHHDCDNESQDCTDTETSYNCTCKKGYLQESLRYVGPVSGGAVRVNYHTMYFSCNLYVAWSIPV